MKTVDNILCEAWTDEDRVKHIAALIKQLDQIKDDMQDVFDLDGLKEYRVCERHINNCTTRLVRYHYKLEKDPMNHYMTFRGTKK